MALPTTCHTDLRALINQALGESSLPDVNNAHHAFSAGDAQYAQDAGF